MVWRVKEHKEVKKQKRVSFADPIASELKAPKTNIPDDSIMLIKGNTSPNLQHSHSVLFEPDLLSTTCTLVTDRYTVMVDDEKKEADSVIIGSPIKDITPPSEQANGCPNAVSNTPEVIPAANVFIVTTIEPVTGDNGGGQDRASSALNDKAMGQMLDRLQDLLVSSPHTVLSPPHTHK
jgi:hypothetical protein